MNDLYDDIKSAFEDEQAPEAGTEDTNREDLAADIASAMGGEEPAEEPKKEDVEPEAKAPEAEPEKPDPEAGKEAEGRVDESDEGGVKLDINRAPSSWSAKVREHWKNLPEEVRREVLRREETQANGVRKIHEEYAPVKSFTEALGGVIQEAAGLGIQPVQFIHNMARAEQALRTGAPEQRLEALLALGDQYGIPVRQYLGGGAQPPAQAAQAALPDHVQRELEESRRFREQMLQQQQMTEQQRYEQEVNAFKENNEFFEDVRGLMADLLDANPSRTLAEVYEQAIWAHPEVRSVLLQRQQAAAAEQQGKQRRAAAAGAAVPDGSPVSIDTDDDDSIEGIIRKSMNASKGRI